MSFLLSNFQSDQLWHWGEAISLRSFVWLGGSKQQQQLVFLHLAWGQPVFLANFYAGTQIFTHCVVLYFIWRHLSDMPININDVRLFAVSLAIFLSFSLNLFLVPVWRICDETDGSGPTVRQRALALASLGLAVVDATGIWQVLQEFCKLGYRKYKTMNWKTVFTLVVMEGWIWCSRLNCRVISDILRSNCNVWWRVV